MDEETYYFFSYAYPCSETLRDLGKLSDKDQKKLEKDFLKGIAPSREVLEKSFPVAFQRLEKLGIEMGKSKWDMSVLQKYWREEHNRVIDREEGTYSKASPVLKDLCKVHIAKIIEIKNKELLKVKYRENQIRFVFNHLVPKVKLGDHVTIHYGYAIEIMN